MSNSPFSKAAITFCLIAGAIASHAATPWSEETHQLAFGDFDKDGDDDLLYMANDPQLPSGIVLSQGGSPSVNHQSWPSNHLGIPWHSGIYKPVVCDFDGDGWDDIFLHRQTPGNHYVLHAEEGTGKFTVTTQELGNTVDGVVFSGDAHRIVAGDFDGDSKCDLFLQSTTANGLNYVFRATSSGTFLAHSQSWANEYMGFRWSVPHATIHTGDFDADGRADLLVQAKPSLMIIDYEIPFPVPTYRANSFGIVNGKAGSSPFYGTALQIWSRDYLGLDWSATNFEIVVGNFNGSGGADIFLQGKRSGLQNRLMLSGSGGQFTSGDALLDSVLRTRTADQARLFAANIDGTGPVGLYLQAKTASGTNEIAATITSGGVVFTPHDPNLMNIVTPGSAVGAIPGKFFVDPNGGANYEIPIVVPPGVAKVQPSLGLAYSSRNGNGAIGVGWQLTGISSITRCPTTVAQDGLGNQDGADFDENDAYCLDGQRLIAAVGTNGAVGTTYRTEIETFQKVESKNGTAGNPAYFDVWDKNGLIKRYGKSSDDSENTSFVARRPGATGPVAVWGLRRVSDRFGNFIEYTYQSEADSLEFRPSEITYGSQPSGGSKTVVGRVVFEYTDRLDQEEGYIAGGWKTTLKKRLRRIATYGRANATVPGAADAVSQYYFNYEYSPTSNFSHLSNIVLCDGGSGATQRCLKETSFQWQHGYRGFTTSSEATNVDFGSTVNLKIFDFDGDGRNDYVYRHSTGSNEGEWLIRFASLVKSKGTGSYYTTGFASKQPSRAFPIDWNNDGFTDLVDSTTRADGNEAYAGNYKVLWGSPTPSFVFLPTSIPAEGLTFKGLGTTVGDFDGDGRQDFIYVPGNNGAIFTGNIKLRRNNAPNGAGLESGSLVTSPLQGGDAPPRGSGVPWSLGYAIARGIDHPDSSDFKDEPAVYTINFDGDGKDDLLVRVHVCWSREIADGQYDERCNWQHQIYSWNGSSMAMVWSKSAGTSSLQTKHLRLGDYNGDGLTDVLSYGDGMVLSAGTGWSLDFSTGKGGGTGSFVNAMTTQTLPTTSNCPDVVFSAFEALGIGSYVNPSCTNGTVSLSETLINTAMPFDYNRDGYTDLLFAHSGSWKVLPGSKTGFAGAYLDTGRDARQPKFAMLVDDAADGIADILFPWGSNPEHNWHVLYGRGPAVTGVIEKITDGLGAQTQIQYATTTSTTDTVNYVGTAYKGHTRFPEEAASSTLSGFRQVVAPGFPYAHLAGPIPVVYQYMSDNGVGTAGTASGSVRTTMLYWGLKMNREGRGQLGFSEVRSWNDNSEIETRTRYAQQNFPYVGSVLSYEQRFRDHSTYMSSLAAGPDSSSLMFTYTSPCETNTQCSQINPQPATQYSENADYGRVSYVTNVLAARAVTYGSHKVYIPYERKKTEELYPVTNGVPGSTPYRRTLTEVLSNSTSTADAESSGGISALDIYGNPGATRVTVTNGKVNGDAVFRDEHVTLTSAQYQNFESTWCLSRLVSSSTTHSKPSTNSSGNSHAATTITRTSSSTYAAGDKCVLVSETDDAGITTTYGHDSFGNVISETVSGAGIPSGEVRTSGFFTSAGITSSSYSATQGQFPTEARNALGHAEYTTWDGRFGLAKTVTGPNGLTSQSDYDSLGRKLKETPVTALPAAYSESSMTWCAWMCWDSRGVYTVQVASSDGSRSFTEYDRLGRPVHKHSIGFDGNWIATDAYFDPLGRPYLAARPYKPATQSTKCWDFKTFDALGRVVSTWSSYTSNECTATPLAFNATPAGGQQTQFTYDLITAEGNSTRAIGNSSDSSAYATSRTGYSTVNVMGRVRFVRDELASSGCPSNGAPISANSTSCLQTEYDYDAQGNLTYTKQVGGLGVATASPSTTIETKAWFDFRGLKTQMIDPDMGTWSYTYTPFGELDVQTDAKLQTTDFTYDKLGRVILRVEKLANGTTETTSSFVYDTASMGIGKISTVSSSNGYSETTTYDSLGRFARSKRQLDGSYYYVDQTYDSLGRPDVLKYPGSILGDTSSAPEADTNRLRVRNNYTANGFLASVQDVASGTTYWRADSVNENGMVTQETLGNNRVTKRVYDRATGYISTIRTGSAANDSETQNLEFGFDQAGNLRMRKDSTTGVNGGNGIREEFEYDKLSRLKQMRQYKPASSAGPTVVTENYTYDDFGNLLTKGTSYTDYCYVVRGGANDPCAGVASGRPHAAKRIKLGATSRDYAFDANGNITAATNSMFDTVTWNVANLPKRVSKGSKYSEFWYGANGARFKQQLYRAANDTETTIYFGALYQKMTKVSGASTTVEHTHFISAGGKLVTMAKRTGSGALWNRYTHTDHLGSIVALTNESGALVERSAFDPWGKRTSYSTWGPMTPGTYTAGGTGTGGLIDGVLSTKVGFTSHEHVEELGFVHMNGRVYDNEVGRFFSADPHIQFPFSTQGFNRYAYVGNNPLSYTDPSGFSVDKPSLGRVLSATGDVILSYGSGNVYAIAIAVILKSVGGYLQSGGNFNSFLKWMVKDSLTVTIPFHSKSSGQGSGKTLNANGGSEGSGGGGFFVWLAWGKLIRAVLIAATANSVPKGPDGKLQNAAKKPTNIAEDERPGRFHPGRPIPWDEFYAKYPEVGEMEEWAWKRSLEVKYEYMVWSYVMEGERPIVLYKTATPERRNYIDVLPEEITPPPGYKLATVWHSHPFPWGKDWASDLKRAYSRGPSRYPDDWRKGDWGLAYQNPDVLFSMRSLGNALVAPGKQEWWYYRTITITEPMWEQ